MNLSNTADTLIVLYDGACQLCRREIAHVQGPVTLEIPNSRRRSEILSPSRYRATNLSFSSIFVLALHGIVGPTYA